MLMKSKSREEYCMRIEGKTPERLSSCWLSEEERLRERNWRVCLVVLVEVKVVRSRR